jgi:hypothetical protein
MKTIQALERAAVAAHTRGVGWTAFWELHGAAVRACDPYNAGRYRRLYLRLLSIVTSGDTNGMMPVADDDSLGPWERDDNAISPHDMPTHARCLWPMSATMPSQNEALP